MTEGERKSALAAQNRVAQLPEFHLKNVH